MFFLFLLLVRSFYQLGSNSYLLEGSELMEDKNIPKIIGWVLVSLEFPERLQVSGIGYFRFVLVV